MLAPVTSLRRTDTYRLGGVLQLIAIPFFAPDRTAGFTVTRTSGAITGITLAPNVAPFEIEFEENSAMWKGDTAIGNNRYIKPAVGFKYAELSDDSNKVKKALDLRKHTFAVRDKNGKCYLVGELNGMQTDQSLTGTAAGTDDFFGMDVTLVGGETEPVPVLPSAAFDTLLEAIAAAEV